MDDGQRQLGIVGGGVLDEAGQRGGVVQGLTHALPIEFGDPVGRVPGGRGSLDRRSLHLPQRQALGVLAGEELLVRTGGGGNPLERGGVRDEVGDPVVDDDPGLAAELRELDSPRVLLGRYFVSASGVSYMCWSASKIGASVNWVISSLPVRIR